MSGNASEWSTEYSTQSKFLDVYPCVYRGGGYSADDGVTGNFTSLRVSNYESDNSRDLGLRLILYVK